MENKTDEDLYKVKSLNPCKQADYKLTGPNELELTATVHHKYSPRLAISTVQPLVESLL